MKKKMLALIVSICMILSSVCMNAAAVTEGLTVAAADARDTHICEMLDELMELKVDEANYNGSASVMTVQNSRIQEIENELELLGVEEVSPCDLAGAQLNVITPTSTVNDWFQWTTNVTYGGEEYSVTTLRAQPKSNNSSLMDIDAEVISAAPGVMAMACDYLVTYATTGVSALGRIGEVVVTAFEMLSSAIPAMSTSTYIENVSATYNWQACTTMYYKYVKPADSAQEPVLSYMYNSVTRLVHVLTNNITYGSTFVDLDFDSDEYSKTYCVGSTSVATAVDTYINYQDYGMGPPDSEFVYSAVIKGADDTMVVDMRVCNATVPGLVDVW